MSEVSSITTIGDDIEPTTTRTDDPEDIETRLDKSEDITTRLDEPEDAQARLNGHEHVEKRADDLESTISRASDLGSATTKVNDYESITAKTADYESIVSKRHDSQSRLVWDDDEEFMTRSRRWRKSLQLTWSRYGDNWWPEITALCLSFACTWAMVLILQNYDSKEVPRLPFQLTLNAVISILATTSKVSLMYIVSNAIGQTKWVWFSKRARNLLDVEIFDDASRGPLGSLHLLSARTRTSLGSIGAILTLLAVVYDPFVQQIVVMQPQPDPQISQNANMTMSTFFATGADDLSSFAALNAGVWGSGGLIKANCSSNNCRWKKFKSVEWCSKCENVTRYFSASSPCSFADAFRADSRSDTTQTRNMSCFLNSKDDSTPSTLVNFWSTANFNSSVEYLNYTAPNGNHSFSPNSTQSKATITIPMIQVFKLNNTFINGSVSELWNTNPPQEGFIQLAHRPMISFASTTFDYDNISLTLKNPSTIKCSLDLCVKSHNISVIDGTVVSDSLEDDFQFGTWSRQLIPGASWTNQGGYSPNFWYYCWTPNDEDVTKISDGPRTDGIITAKNTNHSLAFCISPDKTDSFWDWNQYLPLPTEDDSTSTLTYTFLRSNITESVHSVHDIGLLPQSEANPQEAPDANYIIQSLISNGVNETAQNIALSLTQLAVRMNPFPIFGTLGSSVSYLHVRGVWLIMPVLLPCSCFLFLVAVMWESHHSSTPLWKSSVNALFYHGIDHVIGVDAPLEKVSQLDAQASLTSARLVPTGRDDRLLLESSVIRLTP